MAKKIVPGSLIVIEKKQSEDNEELARQDERHGAMLRQWIKSIYLIVDTQQGVIAVNLQRRTPGPPGRTQELSWQRFYQAVEAQCAEALERTEHYIGGPVEPGSALYASISMEETVTGSSCTLAVKQNNLNVYCGRPDKIFKLAKLRHTEVGKKSVVRIFWGFAAWDSTQLLAELAKRFWGL